MKQFSIFLFVLASACHTPAPTSSTQANSASTGIITAAEPQKVVFGTGSRGYQRAVVLTKDSVLVTINSSFEDLPSKNVRTAITTAEWNNVTGSLKGVNISGLNALESPTMKRAVDAANHSSIAVTTDKEYIHGFDNTDPHEQLKKLMAVILEIEASRIK